jgi:hypothetical protein
MSCDWFWPERTIYLELSVKSTLLKRGRLGMLGIEVRQNACVCVSVCVCVCVCVCVGDSI